MFYYPEPNEARRMARLPTPERARNAGTIRPNAQTRAETIAELRAEVDSFADRIKAELLAELRVEVKRLISMEVTHASQQR
jgi:hypothetical protein